jgi:acetyl-CoA carboxylase carboxyltransferase component
MNALKSALGLTTTVETEEVEVETADRNIGVLGALVSKVAYNLGAEDSGIADLMHKVWVRRAELAEEHKITAGGLPKCIELGAVDEIVAPTKTRTAIAAALKAAANPDGSFARGNHGNIPL